jgi:Mn-dependent DtxR family transcriptional regulator
MADSTQKTEKLLEDIKKLMILELIEKGVQSKDIASILKIDPATITRLVPRKKK